jgi:hypothetical protein
LDWGPAEEEASSCHAAMRERDDSPAAEKNKKKLVLYLWLGAGGKKERSKAVGIECLETAVRL